MARFGDILSADADFGVFRVIKTGMGNGDLFFNALTRGFSNGDTVLTANIIYNGPVKAVATDRNGSAKNHASQRNDADFGGAAADV